MWTRPSAPWAAALGGIFALYAAFEAPGLFQGHISASPAVKPFEGWFLPYEAAHHKDGNSLPIRQFHDTLEIRHYTGLDLKWRIVDGERHAGTKAESYSRGLRWVFAPLAPDPNGKWRLLERDHRPMVSGCVGCWRWALRNEACRRDGRRVPRVTRSDRYPPLGNFCRDGREDHRSAAARFDWNPN